MFYSDMYMKESDQIYIYIWMIYLYLRSQASSRASWKTLMGEKGVKGGFLRGNGWG